MWSIVANGGCLPNDMQMHTTWLAVSACFVRGLRGCESGWGYLANTPDQHNT